MLMITEQHFGSAGIIVFILAYLSKGMRRSSANTKTFVRTESVAMSLDRSLSSSLKRKQVANL